MYTCSVNNAINILVEVETHVANITPYCPPPTFGTNTLTHTYSTSPMKSHLFGLRLNYGNTSVHLHIIFTMFSSSPLPDQPQNGPAAWCMAAGLLAPCRCDLERHGPAGKLWTTATPGHSHSCAPRTELRRSALRVWEVKHICSLCVWDVVWFTDEAIIVCVALAIKHLFHPTWNTPHLRNTSEVFITIGMYRQRQRNRNVFAYMEYF